MPEDTQDQADQRDADQDESTEQHDTDTLGAKGEAALKAEREARKRAEKRIKELEDAEAERQAEEQKKADAERIEQGKWEELATKREAELTAKTTSLQAMTAERDTLLSIVKADVDAAWDTIPEEVREAYDGEDDDVLAKKQHMTRNAKIIARLQDTGGQPGNRQNPKGSGSGKPKVPSAVPASRMW